MTNYDKIRYMGYGEMANYLSTLSDCKNCPVKEDNMCKWGDSCKDRFNHWLACEVEECQKEC